jgi:imidazolonepropionase-like amidohydrolase
MTTRLSIAASTLLVSGAALLLAQPQAPPILALVHARVIDGTGAAPHDDWTVLVRGDRIAAAGPRVDVPGGSTVIDVSNKSVLPGLIDMHGHMYAATADGIANAFEAYPALYLAGGVTSVRSPGDFDPDGMYWLKEAIARGAVDGPRIFMGGYYIDDSPSQIGWFSPVRSPADVTERIAQWKGRIDVVKFYTRTTEAQMKAGIAAAKAAGLPTTAHLGSITAARAIDLGIDGLEHGIYAMPELGAPQLSPSAVAGCPLGDLDLDGRLVTDLIGKIVKRQVAIDPTFVMVTFGLPDTQPLTPNWRAYFADGRASAIAAQVVAWTGAYDQNPVALACAQRTRRNAMQFVARVQRQGGIILAGTDPVAAYVLPGWGMHRELKHLTEAGLTPVQAIRAATSNAARVLRRDEDLGSIAAGRLADLIVVGGDPSTRIEDIGRVEMVFKAGRRFDPTALRDTAKHKLR